MEYYDRVYGRTNLTDTIVLDLLESPSFERLKHIDQAGYFEPYVPGSALSRYEHSLGVYILLHRYGAHRLEQIAGLLHDISHSAFSHCIDYVLRTGTEQNQSHQDDIFADYVSRTDIPARLKSHGIDFRAILNDDSFPLKERPLPDLCADRIDYSFRNALIFGVTTGAEVSTLLDQLHTEGPQWIFDNAAAGRQYAEMFKRLNTEYYAGIQSATMFYTVGEYLKYGLQKGYITLADLYTTDALVLEKLRHHHAGDTHLQRLFRRMQGEYTVVNDRESYEARVVCKSRDVDPACRTETGIRRLSEIEADWKPVVTVENQPKYYYLRFLDG